MSEVDPGVRSPQGAERAEPAYEVEARLVSAGLRRSGLASDEADDIAQEAVVRSLTRAGPMSEEHRAAWLQTVALNLVRDRWRKERRQEAQRPKLERESPVAAPSAEETALGGIEAEVLGRALSSLAPQARMVLRLRVMERRPASEVAAIIGKSEESVRQIQLRSLRKLRDLLLQAGWQAPGAEESQSQRVER